MERERKIVEEAITSVSEAGSKAPKLEGVPTGVPGLDELFFVVRFKRRKPVKEVLGGIPRGAVMNLAGVSDTGKSLMAEQYAVKQAERGERVAFITVESPAAYVARGLELRAAAMGVDKKLVDENVVLIDAASYSVLREDMLSLLDTLAHAIRTYDVKHVVIDSITGLYEAREMQARLVVRQVFNFLKKWHQTALLVSQKRSGHEALTAEVAGGYGVAHIVDGTIVLSKEVIDSSYKERLYGVPLGETVRFLRIDGCRLSGHDTQTRLLEITEEGLVKVGPSLAELKAQRKK